MPDKEMDSQPPTVKATFSMPVGDVFLNASAVLPAGQTTLTNLLPVVQNLENAILTQVVADVERAGSSISCRAGCGACCRQMVPLSLFEAEALIKWMNTLPEERRKELEERFHKALSELRDAGIIDRLMDQRWTLGEEAATQLNIDYFRAGVACPFLEDESCSIHPFRPLACREYLVTSSPELCVDPGENDVFGLQLPLKLSRVLYAFGQKMERDPQGWIPMIFLMAWSKSGFKPGERVAGTGPEVLKKFLEQVCEMAEQDKKDKQDKKD